MLAVPLPLPTLAPESDRRWPVPDWHAAWPPTPSCGRWNDTLSPVVLPFPTRVPVWRALIFTFALVLLQLLEHTDPRYSALTFCFFMLSVFAFNTAGGFSRPSGGYIFAYSVFVVGIGTVVKALLGEPAQTNLQSPFVLMGAYVASIAGMLLAAFLSRKIATTTDGIAGVLKVTVFNYYESALGCLIIYFLIQFAGVLLPGFGGQALHSIQIINPFLPLSILLGTISAVRDSKGTRSLNFVNGIAMWFTFYGGMLSFSKQGMFTPITCWLIGLAWARFRLRFIQLACIFAFAILAQKVLVPMASVGRGDVTTGSDVERRALVEHYFMNISELRRRAAAWEAPPDMDYRMYYFNQPEGILDRLSMMPNDSVLVQYSDQGHLFGYLAVRYYFENWVPHLIDPHKLEGVRVGGNAYMHEMGGLADEDTTTGISFSPTAEAFHIDGWRGVLLLAPAVWTLLFVTCDATCGDIRRQPLGLLYILVFAHVAPEGLLGGAIDLVRLVNAAFTLAVCFCGYVAPVIGMLLRGQRPSLGSRVRPGAALAGISRGAIGAS